MSGWRQLAGGLAITVVVVIIIGVSLSSAIAQNRLLVEPLAPTRTLAPTEVRQTETQLPPTTNEAGTGTATDTPVPPTHCAPPDGWLAYTIREGDTIQSIAAQIGANPDEIAAANCLTVGELIPNTTLYLPLLPQTATATGTGTATPSPTATLSPVPSNTGIACGHPGGWVLYTVQSGDTLFSLAQATNTSVEQLQFANCLGNSTYIQAGAKIWLPFIPPTPTMTPTPSPEPTASPTTAPSPSATTEPTGTPSPTETEPPTATPTPSPTHAPPTRTPTSQPPTPTGTQNRLPASNVICYPNACAPVH